MAIIICCTDDTGESASWLTDLTMDAAEGVMNGEDSSKDSSDLQVCISSVFCLCIALCILQKVTEN